MIAFLAGISIAIDYASSRPFAMQFMHGVAGRNVTVCIDGQKAESTFAGKLSFQDGNRSWTSYCADVRSPVSEGQIYAVRALRTDRLPPNYAKAGNIVARYFREAQTDVQCAGLQLAVWKAIEDGTDKPDFSSGHLQARAEPAVIAFATMYYAAAQTPGSANLLTTTGSQGQNGPQSSATGQSQISM